MDMVEHHLDGKGGEKITFKDKWINNVISLMYMLYPTLCTATFSLVGCHHVGKYNDYIQRDMEFQCWKTTEHLLYVILIFVPALILYVIGLPVSSLYVLRKNQHILHINRRIKFQLSILCVGYRPTMEHWESIVSLRKGLVVGISIFVLQAGPKLQTLAAQLLIGLLLVLQTSYQPYVKVASRHNPLNHAEFFGLTAAFLTLTFGMYLYHYGESSSGSFKNTAYISIIVINVLFFILAMRWYTVIYLVDLEMENDRNKASKNIGNTYLAYALQRCLPDWREESHLDDIENAEMHKRRIAQLMSVDRLMRLKGFAKKWAERTRVSIEQKKVLEIQQTAERSKEKFELHLVKTLTIAKLKLQKKLKLRVSQRKARSEALGIARVQSGLARNGTIQAMAKMFHNPCHCLPALELHLFMAPEDGYVCDACQQLQVKGLPLYGCEVCEYDLCSACNDEEREKNAVRVEYERVEKKEHDEYVLEMKNRRGF